MDCSWRRYTYRCLECVRTWYRSRRAISSYRLHWHRKRIRCEDRRRPTYRWPDPLESHFCPECRCHSSRRGSLVAQELGWCRDRGWKERSGWSWCCRWGDLLRTPPRPQDCKGWDRNWTCCCSPHRYEGFHPSAILGSTSVGEWRASCPECKRRAKCCSNILCSWAHTPDISAHSPTGSRRSRCQWMIRQRWSRPGLLRSNPEPSCTGPSWRQT